MILGMEVTVRTMMVGGLVVLTLLLFQVLTGLRVIKMGRKKRVVHKWTGIAVLCLAAVHGFLGVVFGLGLKIL